MLAFTVRSASTVCLVGAHKKQTSRNDLKTFYWISMTRAHTSNFNCQNCGNAHFLPAGVVLHQYHVVSASSDCQVCHIHTTSNILSTTVDKLSYHPIFVIPHLQPTKRSFQRMYRCRVCPRLANRSQNTTVLHPSQTPNSISQPIPVKFEPANLYPCGIHQEAASNSRSHFAAS